MQRNVQFDKKVKSITTVLSETSYFCVFTLRPDVIKRPSATRLLHGYPSVLADELYGAKAECKIVE